jgi:hypothetical protein
MAGQAEMMCKYGAGDKVLQLKSLDAFGFGDFYGVTEHFENTGEMILRSIKLEPEYDYVIVHDYPELIKDIPEYKLIYVFHGTKLRNMSKEERQYITDSGIPVYVTTIDLLDLIPSTYLPNMVDLEHFTPGNTEEIEFDSWFCINRSYQRDFIEKKIREKYPKIEYYERNTANIIDYEDMPIFLYQHSDYVDWKFTYDKPDPLTVHAISCTGLQALAVGCTVHDGNGTVIDRKALLIHDAKRVVQEFLKDYG